MNRQSPSSHNATPALAGYLYQILYALHLILPHVQEPDAAISVESLDDIVFAGEGTPQELVQTKHHVQRLGSLTDASADLWATMRVWCDLLRGSTVSPSNTRFVIVTTGSAPPGSVASMLMLMDSQRDTKEAARRLEEIASKSTNANHQSAHEAFMSLPSDIRASLVESIFVIPNSPDISQLMEELAGDLYVFARPEHVGILRDRLTEWWLLEVIRQLNSPDHNPILASRIHSHIQDIRDELLQDSLPILFSDAQPDPPDLDPGSDKRRFVRQLHIVQLSAARIRKAQLDYYRASEQRSRWLKDDLLHLDKLQEYDSKLIDEWERRFQAMLQAIPEGTSEPVQATQGREFYEHLQIACADSMAFTLRRAPPSSFIPRGSYHILADGLQVGWHPDYRTLT